MEKIKHKKRTFLLFIFLLVFVGCSFVGMVEAKSITIESMGNLLKDTVNLDYVRSYLGDVSGFWGLMFGKAWSNTIAGFADSLFNITLVLYEIFDFLIDKLYSMNVLAQLNETITTLTNHLWTTFKANYVGLILLFSLVSIARKFFLESAKEALLFLGKIFLVLVISGIWFPNASSYLNQMNDLSFEMQAEVLRTAGQLDATSALSGETELADATATEIIRNELFIQTVYRPFLLMNYGTTNGEKINDMYAKVKNKEIPKNTNGKYLASKEFAALDSKKQKEQLSELAKHNPYLTGEKVMFKYVIALLSIVAILVFGLILTLISFINVWLQLLTVLYQYILPLIALVSLLPRYSGGLMNSIGNIIKLYFFKALLALGILMFCLINVTIDLLIPPENYVPVLANLFTKMFVYLLLWKGRGFILRSLMQALNGRGGDVMVRMQQGSQEFFQKGLDYAGEVKDTAIEGTKSAALAAAGLPPVALEGMPSTEPDTPFVNDSSPLPEEKDEDDLSNESIVMQEQPVTSDSLTEDNDPTLASTNDQIASQDALTEEELAENIYIPEEDVQESQGTDTTAVEYSDDDRPEDMTVDVEDPTVAIEASEDVVVDDQIEVEEGAISGEETARSGIETPNESSLSKEQTETHYATNTETREAVTSSNKPVPSTGAAPEKKSNGTEKNVPAQPQVIMGDKKVTINQHQHNEQHAEINVRNQTTNRVRTNDFERLLRKYRGTDKQR